MFNFLFSNSITIPTLRLSGVIGQTGIFRSGLTFQGIDKLIENLSVFVKNITIVNEILTVNPDRKHLLVQF